MPTLAEVLEEFPNTPINIEIKGQEDQESEFVRNAELLADCFSRTRPARPDRRVVQPGGGRPLPRARAGHRHRARAEWARGLLPEREPMPDADAVVAIQVPDGSSATSRCSTPERVLQAHRAGWAVHIWLSGNEENKRVYNDILDHCVDGIMPARPTALEKVLRKRDVVRPDGKGTDPCSAAAKRATLTDDGDARVLLRRRGLEPVAYRGRVQLRSRKGKLLGERARSG